MRLRLAALTLGVQAAFAAPPGYVDSAVCRNCHEEIYDSYEQTSMGRSLSLPAEAPQIEEWNASYYHEASDRHYEMLSRKDGLYIGRYQLDSLGSRIHEIERKVTHIMGSGDRARSYLHQYPDGRMIELPVSWYSQEKAWAMSPGYDRPGHTGFTRQVNHKCMFCHNAYPDVPPEQARTGFDADVRFQKELPLGIGCQRCHGPGADHSSTAKPEEIVNPGKLSPARQLDVCMQCHLETTTFRLPDSYRRFGRSFYSFEPGEPLGDYVVHFDHARGKQDDKFEIVSAAYRLRQSPCFLASSGEMTCTSCHDPHRSAPAKKKATYYRDRCIACHEKTGHVAEFVEQDCTACHMPKRRTEDVVHVVMTDHKVQRNPPRRDLRAPLAEKTDEQQTYRGQVVWHFPPGAESDPLRDVYLGIAQVKHGANPKGLKAFSRALEKSGTNHPEPYFELAEVLAERGQVKPAERIYREAIAKDPAFVQAHHNLAKLLADNGRSKEAVAGFQRTLELDAGSADTYVNLGLTLLDLSDLEGARSAFQKAVETDPNYVEGRFNYGSLLLAQGQVGEAYPELLAAASLEPAHARTQFNLGLLLRAVGKPREARERFGLAVKYGDEDLVRAARQQIGKTH